MGESGTLHQKYATLLLQVAGAFAMGSAFRLLFQPIISLRGDEAENYETFLRLLNSKGEEVPASDFLPAAMEAGLALEIDRWLISRAVKLLSNHRSKGAETHLLLNLSAASLQSPDMVQWIAAILKEARLPADAIIFQFNDADINTYLKQAKVHTDALRQMHCRVSISHFGGALNPYASLKHVQADYIQIDGSFTRDLSTAKAVDTLKEMISALHNQGKLTIAPYVDSATMMPTLWQAGVNYIQGSYLQAPSDAMNYDFSAE